MIQNDGARWIQVAENDLSAAQSLLQTGHYPLYAFHAQQAVEKALKGLLRLNRQMNKAKSATKINNHDRLNTTKPVSIASSLVLSPKNISC